MRRFCVPQAKPCILHQENHLASALLFFSKIHLQDRTLSSESRSTNIHTLLSYRAHTSSSMAYFHKLVYPPLKASVVVFESFSETVIKAKGIPFHQFEVFQATREDFCSPVVVIRSAASTKLLVEAVSPVQLRYQQKFQNFRSVHIMSLKPMTHTICLP